MIDKMNKIVNENEALGISPMNPKSNAINEID